MSLLVHVVAIFSVVDVVRGDESRSVVRPSIRLFFWAFCRSILKMATSTTTSLCFFFVRHSKLTRKSGRNRGFRVWGPLGVVLTFISKVL